MVKRCCLGKCNTDSRHLDKLEDGVSLIPFPKPARSLEKCLRLIKLCDRPRQQLNVDVLKDRAKGKHFYVCSKHFKHGDLEPTLEFPDPESASPYDKPSTPRRPPPKKRTSCADSNSTNVIQASKQPSEHRIDQHIHVVRVSLSGEHEENIPPEHVSSKRSDDHSAHAVNYPETQNLEMLAMTAENRKMKEEITSLKLEKNRLKEETAKLVLEKEDLVRSHEDQQVKDCDLHVLRYNTISHQDFQYYTGFSYERYIDVAKFLLPNDTPFQYSKNMSCLRQLSLNDQLLLVFIKLRQNFDFHHLSTLFGISSQDCSTLFSDWINFMFHRLGSVPIWPRRDIIIENMPAGFKRDFPDTMVIIDGTEIKVQKPSSLHTQSKFYSDYKSSTTLKGIVGVDPRGSIIFVSMLFPGSVSDNELTDKCGFYELIKNTFEQ